MYVYIYYYYYYAIYERDSANSGEERPKLSHTMQILNHYGSFHYGSINTNIYA